jgi:hypothetical protein
MSFTQPLGINHHPQQRRLPQSRQPAPRQVQSVSKVVDILVVSLEDGQESKLMKVMNSGQRQIRQ